MKPNIKLILIAFLILLLGGFLRTWHLSYPDYSGDELHVTNDALGFCRNDPYVSLRHHPYHHGFPSVGHPFLQPAVIGVFMCQFGQGLYIPRLVPAISGLLTCLVLLSLLPPLTGRKVAFLSAFFYAIIPFAVRFNRDVHFDSMFALWLTLAVISIWCYLKKPHWWWLVVAGVSSGLAISTKLDGIIVAGTSGLVWLIYSLPLNRKKILSVLFLFLLPAIVVSLILNDPGAYLDGIIHPTDQVYQIGLLTYFSRFISSGKFWVFVFAALLSPLMCFIWPLSLRLIFLQKDRTLKVLLLWQVLFLPVIFFHGPGGAGEYGLLPIVPAILIGISFWIVKKRLKSIYVIVLTVIMMVFTYLYGLRFQPVPYYPPTSDLTQDNIVNETVLVQVNRLAPKNSKVFLLPSMDYPYFALRSDISWSYFGDLKTFNLFVVEDEKIIDPAFNNFKLIKTLNSREYGKSITRKIYENMYTQ